MMKISLRDLRRIISEEIDRLVRRSAGFGGSAGIAGRGSGESPPLGLGDEEQQKEERYGKEQEKSQFAVRVDSRKRRTSGQD